MENQSILETNQEEARMKENGVSEEHIIAILAVAARLVRIRLDRDSIVV
jgi:hypothetical protein